MFDKVDKYGRCLHVLLPNTELATVAIVEQTVTLAEPPLHEPLRPRRPRVPRSRLSRRVAFAWPACGPVLLLRKGERGTIIEERVSTIFNAHRIDEAHTAVLRVRERERHTTMTHVCRKYEAREAPHARAAAKSVHRRRSVRLVVRACERRGCAVGQRAACEALQASL